MIFMITLFFSSGLRHLTTWRKTVMGKRGNNKIFPQYLTLQFKLTFTKTCAKCSSSLIYLAFIIYILL